MERDRFDALTRKLGDGRSRRDALKLLGGGLVAVGLTKFGSETAAAASKVTICHYPPGNPGNVQIISVGASAVPAHLAHGDQYYCASSDSCVAGNECCDDSACAGLGDTCNAGVCNNGFCETVPNGACCANAVLAGSADGGSVCVDDDLHITVRGDPAFDYVGPATCFGQISLGPVNGGDSIHVVANNSSFYCGDIGLTPLYLICLDNDAVQTLDATGVAPGPQPGCGVVFYDQTFTAAI